MIKCTHSTAKKLKLQKKIQGLLDLKIRVFHDGSFDNLKQQKIICSPIPEIEKFQKERIKTYKTNLCKTASSMRPCYEAPLLNFEQEQHLFRQMNFYKYQAKKSLATANPLKMGEKRVKEIERNLAKAELVRNQIAESNFRLATQLLKGSISFYKQHSLVEGLLSDGYLDVLRAIDYFNWTKGFKFSTYTTWVLKKNFYRDFKVKTRDVERFGSLDDIKTDALESNGSGYAEEVKYDENKKLVKKLLSSLKRNKKYQRQVVVLENYFGIGREKQTLEDISKKIGVTRERVRQLKEKGLELIQEKISELGIKYECN